MACTIVVLLSWCKPFRLWELPAEKHGHQPLKCFLIRCSHGFPGRVHGQEWQPYVHGAHGHVGGQEGTQSGTSPHVRTVQEKLIGNVMAFAETAGDGNRFGVTGIGLAAGCFQNQTSVEDRNVGGVVLAGIEILPV